MKRPGASAQAPSHGSRTRPPPLGVPAEPGRPELNCPCAGWGGIHPQAPRAYPFPTLRPKIPHEAPLSLRSPATTGGTRVSPPPCGWGTSPCAQNPPRGVPIPPRPRQDRRDSGVTAAVWGRDLSVSPQPPRGRPYPSAAQAGPEGFGCNRRCVGEGPILVPTTVHGAPLSLRAPGRTGGTRV